MKEKRKPFIQRIISAVIVFLIPWFVGLILGNVGGEAWKGCWNDAKDFQDDSIFDSGRDPMNPDSEY